MEDHMVIQSRLLCGFLEHLICKNLRKKFGLDGKLKIEKIELKNNGLDTSFHATVSGSVKNYSLLGALEERIRLDNIEPNYREIK